TLPDAMEGPLGGLARRLDDLLAAAADELDIERSQRLALEARLGKVGHLLDGFEQRAARYDALAAESRDDAGMTGEALATSGVRLRQALAMGQEAQELVSEADLAVRRTQALVGEIDRMTLDVDQ